MVPQGTDLLTVLNHKQETAFVPQGMEEEMQEEVFLVLAEQAEVVEAGEEVAAEAVEETDKQSVMSVVSEVT